VKKVLILVIIILSVLLSCISYADMDAPQPVIFTAYVSNSNGANYYKDYYENSEKLGTIPFKSKIICSFYDGSSSYASFVFENEKYSFENEKFIDLNDITIDDLTKYELGNKTKVKTFEEAKIYNLPSKDEGTVIGRIPFFTDIEVQPYKGAVDTNVGVSSWSYWYYVSYDGLNGWIGIDSFAKKYDAGNSFVAHDIKTKDGKVLPYKTLLSESYSFGGGKHTTIAVVYDGVAYFLERENDITSSDLFFNNAKTFTTPFDGIPLFEQASKNSKKVVNSIPANANLPIEETAVGWNYPEWLLTSYNGVEGWLFIGGLDYTLEEVNKHLELNKNIWLLKKVNSSNAYKKDVKEKVLVLGFSL